MLQSPAPLPAPGLRAGSVTSQPAPEQGEPPPPSPALAQLGTHSCLGLPGQLCSRLVLRPRELGAGSRAWPRCGAVGGLWDTTPAVQVLGSARTSTTLRLKPAPHAGPRCPLRPKRAAAVAMAPARPPLPPPRRHGCLVTVPFATGRPANRRFQPQNLWAAGRERPVAAGAASLSLAVAGRSRCCGGEGTVLGPCSRPSGVSASFCLPRAAWDRLSRWAAPS